MLAQAILFAKDIRRLTAFYENALELARNPERSDDTWVELGSGSAALALHAIPADIAQRIEIAEPPVPREDTAIKLVFRVPDVAAARTRVVEHGGFTVNAHDAVDPEGNVFRLIG